MATWFVMLEGSTQEEERTEEELTLLAQTGAFRSENLVYVQDGNCWVRAGESPLQHLFGTEEDLSVGSGEGEGKEELTPHEKLEAEYTELRATLEESPGALDVTMRLAEVAAQLGDKFLAKKVIREALEKSPYNQRIAALAKKLFSAQDLRNVPFLERTPPFWKDLGGLIQYPFLDNGVVHILITGTILYVTSFVPFVGPLFAGLVYFYLLEVIRTSSSGKTTPPNWDFDIPSIVALFLKPMIPSLIVITEVSAPFLLVAFLATDGDGLLRGVNMMVWTFANPPFFLLWALVCLVYFPAVLMIIAISDEHLGDAMNPAKIIATIRVLKEDYLMALAFFAVFSFLTVMVVFMLGWIPLAGPWLGQCVVFLSLMISGRVLGLTCRRHLHSFV